MKTKVFTRLLIKKAWLDEVVALIPGLTIEVVETKEQMTVYMRPYIYKFYGDFASIRKIINDNAVQVRAFYMPYKELAALGITDHLALYDNTDRDGIFDFYVGLQPRLDARAKKNGFKSNFAWEFIHEILHGYEQNQGREDQELNGDRTHDWEAQGKLKALLTENLERGISLQKKQITLLESIVAALKGILANKPPTQLLHPVEKYREMISQVYGNPDPKTYPLTGVHIGTDYACPRGTSVLAPWDGKVTVSGNSPVMGNFCHYEYVFNSQKYVARFMHLSNVPHQASYKRGEVVELSGKTGMSTGYHLHADVWKDEVRLDLINKNNWSTLTVDPHIHYAIT